MLLHGPRATELYVQNPPLDSRMKIATGRTRRHGTDGWKLWCAAARRNAMVARQAPMSRQGTMWRRRPGLCMRKEKNVPDTAFL